MGRPLPDDGEQATVRRLDAGAARHEESARCVGGQSAVGGGGSGPARHEAVAGGQGVGGVRDAAQPRVGAVRVRGPVRGDGGRGHAEVPPQLWDGARQGLGAEGLGRGLLEAEAVDRGVGGVAVEPAADHGVGGRRVHPRDQQQRPVVGLERRPRGADLAHRRRQLDPVDVLLLAEHALKDPEVRGEHSDLPQMGRGAKWGGGGPGPMSPEPGPGRGNCMPSNPVSVTNVVQIHKNRTASEFFFAGRLPPIFCNKCECEYRVL